MKTIKRDNEFPSMKFIMLLLIFSLMSFSTVTFSQEVEDTEEDTDEDVVELAPIVATGSRLLRETYESISPVQVITAQQSRAVGQINADDILQNSTAASGQQIDLTFSGFVLDNGPGATTISFRNLGPGRTLFLLNGRRVGPSGVEGVPSAPDLSLVPGGLVERYELLLDGASSLYGSDAVAGVANAILRKDFNGWEVDYNTTIPERSGGIENTVSLTWGQNYDRGFIGFGAQINENEEIKFRDRPWTNRCEENREEDRNGNITSRNLDFLVNSLMDVGSCQSFFTTGRIRMTPQLSNDIYYTPGTSHAGFGDYSDPFVAGIPVDSNGDGFADVNFDDFAVHRGETDGSLRGERKTQNLMSYGEYTFEGESNITPYFEVLYSRRDTFQDSGQAQLFPFVSATNPYNICNPDGVNGFDCGLAYDQTFENPNYIADYIAEFGCDPSADGNCDDDGNNATSAPQVGAVGAIRTRPIVGVQGDRDQTSATVKQYRAVFGVKGDLPGMDWGQMSNWNFDTYLSYHLSEGVATRAGIREDRLDYSLDTSRIDPVTGQVVCGNNDGCVPINLFAPSLYSRVGNFATQAERDYLFDLRTFNTKIQQTMFSAFLNGYVYELPAGPLAAGIGFEIREDEIESIPDDIARDGLFFGFFSDAGATGKKTTKEVFAEVNVPLLAGYKGVESLDFNISGRFTKDEFFPSADTFSAKLGYRPIPSLFLKATLGTSYRAPNLRENFLLAQSGFGNVGDPCVVPSAAYEGNDNTPVGEYSSELDLRDDTVVQNCLLQGVSPATLEEDNLNGGFSTYQTEITRGGSTNVTEERSNSLTYGFAWDVPFDGDFNMTVGATYYEIDVNNTIVESTTGSIISGCYGDDNFNSTLCQRIVRGPDGLILNVDAGFVNRDNFTVRGVDVNLNMDSTYDIFGKPVDFGVDVILTHTKENSELFLGDIGPEDDDFEDFAGEFGLPRWSGTLNFRARYNDFRFNWQTRYIGSVSVDILDYFGNIEGVETIDVRDINGNGDTAEVLTIFSDTCQAPDVCRDVGDASDYYVHTASVFYENNDWTLGFGIRNVFDDAPPEVDPSETGVIGNAPIGQGYDTNGRRYFINVGYRF